MKMIPATCQCGEEFLREPHDDYPRCSECFFTHDAPDLKRLTDEVSETEKRPGNPRQETNRTAPTETPTKKESSVMSDSTTRRAEQDHSDEPPQVKDALNRWAEGKATFGDLMLASQDAGVDPGPVIEKAMRSTFTEEQLEFLQQEEGK